MVEVWDQEWYTRGSGMVYTGTGMVYTISSDWSKVTLLKISQLPVCLMTSPGVTQHSKTVHPPHCSTVHLGHRATSYDVACLLMMVPLEPWQNSTPIFGAAAFCTKKIDDFGSNIGIQFCLKSCRLQVGSWKGIINSGDQPLSKH